MITKAKPNVIPLCDILLVLIIIFMIISPMAQAGVDIRIPDEGGNGPKIVLSIEKENVVMLNKEKYISLEELTRRLKDVYQIRSDKKIFVQADENVSYKFVIEVLDNVKGAGIEIICLNLRRIK